MDEAGGGARPGGSIFWPPPVPAPPINPWRRPLSWLAVAAIGVYQNTLSRLWPNVCMYTPTCSTYAIFAITTRGLARGLVLASWRIVRCHPFCRGGYDPPPGYGEALRQADREAAKSTEQE